jgi:hypothetical protein
VSHAIDDVYSVYREIQRTARIQHACEACRETISPGHTYWSVSWLFDSRAESTKRCERCQVIHLHLRKKGEGEMWPAERLDCGEGYLDHWGQEPPDEVAALAFALPGEVRAR